MPRDSMPCNSDEQREDRNGAGEVRLLRQLVSSMADWTRSLWVLPPSDILYLARRGKGTLVKDN